MDQSQKLLEKALDIDILLFFEGDCKFQGLSYQSCKLQIQVGQVLCKKGFFVFFRVDFEWQAENQSELLHDQQHKVELRPAVDLGKPCVKEHGAHGEERPPFLGLADVGTKVVNCL